MTHEPTPIIAVDPGKTGGAAYLDAQGEIELHPFRTEADFLDFVSSLESSRAVAVVEDVPRFVAPATSSASAFKLGYSYGFEVGCLRALDFPLHLVRPAQWQKGIPGMKPRMGYTARKRLLRDVASRMFPHQKVTHAVADALLILNYWRERHVGPRDADQDE